MQKHIKVYMDFFGYTEADSINCILCPAVATDIHHIIPRSRIFGKDRDKIENLCPLCRICHDKVHNNMKVYEPILLSLQKKIINDR